MGERCLSGRGLTGLVSRAARRVLVPAAGVAGLAWGLGGPLEGPGAMALGGAGLAAAVWRGAGVR